MNFIDNVIKELQKQNMTQIELCEKTGISINTFRGWSSKNVQPPVDIAYKIANELGITIEQLVTGEIKNPSEKKLQDVKTKLSEIVSEI